jgi:hypothetical protein
LKQIRWQIRRVDRSGMRTKHHSPAFKFETGERRTKDILFKKPENLL